jgi:S1-C subfamily serine protease
MSYAKAMRIIALVLAAVAPALAHAEERAARGSGQVASAVFRVGCPERPSWGTGFFHKSGDLITASHVVHGCAHPVVILRDGSRHELTAIAEDEVVDLALLKPAQPVATGSLPLSNDQSFTVGSEVTTWGYPSAYSGAFPILSAGYLSGAQEVRTANRVVRQWVVNAAFNHGNSGGPLIAVGSGEVIGVVVATATGLSRDNEALLKALANDQSGPQVQVTLKSGATVSMPQSKIIASLIEELRNQNQQLIGRAVIVNDLKSFLRANGVEP